jgi:hypothetical protein
MMIKSIYSRTLFTFLILLVGCNKDDAEPGVAGQYQVDGKYNHKRYCTCTPQIAERQNSGSLSYTVEIVKHPLDSKKVLLKGLFINNGTVTSQLGGDIEAELLGNSLVIPQQLPLGDEGGTIQIKGSGVIAGDQLEIEYIYRYRFDETAHQVKGSKN